MKIVDAFIFYNELDMLKYRLELLDSYVDHFVLVESTYTFSGEKKKLFFNEVKDTEEWIKYKDKIVHVIVYDVPYKKKDFEIVKNIEIWDNEYYQRDCISIGLQNLNLHDTDAFTVMDVDEIPDPNILLNIKQNPLFFSTYKIFSFEQDMYYYDLNHRIKNKWYYPKIVSYKYWLKHRSNLSCNTIRWISDIPYLKQGGWHLSYFGSAQFIQDKIQAFSHQDLNISPFNNLEKIKDRMNRGVDLYDRPSNPIQFINIQDNNYLPPNYKQLHIIHLD